jgi:hypothetical protein
LLSSPSSHSLSSSLSSLAPKDEHEAGAYTGAAGPLPPLARLLLWLVVKTMRLFSFGYKAWTGHRCGV